MAQWKNIHQNKFANSEHSCVEYLEPYAKCSCFTAS